MAGSLSGQLLEYFSRGARPRDRFALGMEVEHVCVHRADGRRLAYAGEGASVEALVRAVAGADYDAPYFEGRLLVGVEGWRGRVSLEPGGQVEWSSPLCFDLTALTDGLGHWEETLCQQLHRQGLAVLESAYDATTPKRLMPWVPKRRYEIMRSRPELSTDAAFDAMTRTAGVHLSLDYCDLDDWARKVRVIILLTPVAVALFANSPAVASGRHYRAYRPVAWYNADPVRTQVPEMALHPRFRIGDWISWLLQVPPLFAASDGGLVPAPHPRLEDVSHGGPVEWADLRLHLSGVFAPVRSYQYLEIRSADVPPAHLLPAVPAFWCGLLYSSDALEAALRLVEPYSSSREWLGLFDEATQHGLVAGSELEKLAGQALELASYGLRHKCACVSRPDLAMGHLMRLATERLPAPRDSQTL